MDIHQNAWHKATSELAATYSEVVIEDLDIAAMKRSMESRPFCRTVCDVPFGSFAPMVGYKA